MTTIPVGMFYKYKTLNGVNILMSSEGQAVVYSMGKSEYVSVVGATGFSLGLFPA